MPMNPCCQKEGNAKIVYSNNPEIAFRVVCQFCGLTIHEERI